MLLHVWVAAWEFECCQPDAVIGEAWGGSFYLGPVAQNAPRDLRSTGESVGMGGYEFGR